MTHQSSIAATIKYSLGFNPVILVKSAMQHGLASKPVPAQPLNSKTKRKEYYAMGLTCTGQPRKNKAWPELAHLKANTPEYHTAYMRLLRQRQAARNAGAKRRAPETTENQNR